MTFEPSSLKLVACHLAATERAKACFREGEPEGYVAGPEEGMAPVSLQDLVYTGSPFRVLGR